MIASRGTTTETIGGAPFAHTGKCAAPRIPIAYD